MSEKRYVIVSPSHHKKPRAMFVCEPKNGARALRWGKSIGDKPLLIFLWQAKQIADETPIGCYIVEHNENLRMWLSDEDTIKFSRFMHISADCGNEIIRVNEPIAWQVEQVEF